MGSRCKTVPYSKNPKLRLHNNNFTEVQLDLDKNLEHHLRYICQKRNVYSFYRIASKTYCYYSSSTADNKKLQFCAFYERKKTLFIPESLIIFSFIRFLLGVAVDQFI